MEMPPWLLKRLPLLTKVMGESSSRHPSQTSLDGDLWVVWLLTKNLTAPITQFPQLEMDGIKYAYIRGSQKGLQTLECVEAHESGQREWVEMMVETLVGNSSCCYTQDWRPVPPPREDHSLWPCAQVQKEIHMEKRKGSLTQPAWSTMMVIDRVTPKSH